MKVQQRGYYSNRKKRNCRTLEVHSFFVSDLPIPNPILYDSHSVKLFERLEIRLSVTRNQIAHSSERSCRSSQCSVPHRLCVFPYNCSFAILSITWHNRGIRRAFIILVKRIDTISLPFCDNRALRNLDSFR
jgi:hypothetical protein